MSTDMKIDSKDMKILSELDINARQSNNKIGKKVGLSKEVVKYRIDRLIKNNVIIKFYTVINYFKLGINKFKLYLRLKNANKEKLDEIGQYFSGLYNTEWVVLTTGKWDMIIGFLVKNVNELDDEVQRFFNKYSICIQQKAITTTLYLAHENRKFLESRKKRKFEKVIDHTSKDRQEKIDNVDEKILRIITNNGRMQITEIAKRLKISQRIVQYRLKDMINKKIILAFKAHLNPKTLGRIFCKIIIYLSNPTGKKLNEFIHYVSSIPDTVWPQKVIGNWDFELDMELENYDKFQNIILDLKEKFPDVIKNHDFCIVSKEFKLDLYPNCYREIY